MWEALATIVTAVISKFGSPSSPDIHALVSALAQDEVALALLRSHLIELDPGAVLEAFKPHASSVPRLDVDLTEEK